jgi:7-alpha-hydroxysteroid dehydrogenase
MGVLDRFRMDDRVAVITGGGRGIGAAIALTFAEAGADVVVSSRTEEQLAEVVSQVEALGRRAVAVTADLNEIESLHALVDRAVEEFGRLDTVVNNVGGTMPRPLLDTSVGFLERAFHFNVSTAFELTKVATPHLLASDGGSVVNISSMMGRRADRGMVAYGTAKGALTHMTRLLACDLAPRVRVNSIAVGSVATSALEVVLENEELEREMVEKTPLQRLGQPEDIALGALWLASPAGSFVTGKMIEIDGGLEAPNLALGLPDLEPT